MFPFGVDLSDLSLKVFQLYQGRGGKIRIGGFVRRNLPPEVLVQGEVKDADKIASILSCSLKKARNKKISGRLAIASLPEIKAFSRVVSLKRYNKEDQEAITKALNIEIEQHIPFEVQEVYLDAELIVENKEKLKFLVSAVPKRIVDGFLEVFRRAKIIPLVLEIESIATARALIYDPELHKEKQSLKNILDPVLIIDLGSKTTTFIIVEQGIVQFTKSIPLASINLTQAIQSGLKVDFEKAEKIKRRYGLAVAAYKGRLFSTLRPHLEKLVKEAKEILRFYELKRDISPEQKIQQILLCGGSANLKGLSDFFSLYLKRETVKANPWINLSFQAKEVPPLPKGEALNFTTSIGLALRGALDKNLF